VAATGLLFWLLPAMLAKGRTPRATGGRRRYAGSSRLLVALTVNTLLFFHP